MNDLRIINDMFDRDLLDAPFRNFLRSWGGDMAEGSPRIRLELSEEDDSYTVKAEIPGVRKEDIDVNVDGNQVTISAEMKKASEQRKGARLLRSERQYGFASRSFSLAVPVDDTKAQAKYHDGVLELTLPKKPSSSSHRLSIS